MSEKEFDIGGKDLREWSFIILMFTLDIAILSRVFDIFLFITLYSFYSTFNFGS